MLDMNVRRSRKIETSRNGARERGRAARRILVRALDSGQRIQSRVAAADETVRFLRRHGGSQGGFGLTRALPEGMNRAGFIFLPVC
jgi:hypothetical protein